MLDLSSLDCGRSTRNSATGETANKHREGEEEHMKHTATRGPLEPKGVLVTWRRITASLGPLGPTLFSSFIDDHSINTQKRSRKSGAQGPLSEIQWKSSALVSWLVNHNSLCKWT